MSKKISYMKLISKISYDKGRMVLLIFIILFFGISPIAYAGSAHLDIENIEKDKNGIEELNTRNLNGVNHLFAGDLLEALNDFDFVIERKSSISDELYGLALWGRVFCHAYLGELHQVEEDIRLLNRFFIERKCACERSHDFYWQTRQDLVHQTSVVIYANPDEKISQHECIARVVGTANSLKAMCAAITRSDIQYLLIKVIEAMEELGIRCCENGTFWTTCVTPLIEKLQKWKVFGIPADPAWD